MRHGDGAAFGDLLFKEGHDGAVRAQDVAETDGDKLRFRRVESDRILLAHCVGLMGERIRLMGVELGDFICFALFDLRGEGLDDHFAQALGGSHDIGGVDGLIGGDEDKTLRTVAHGSVGCFIGADGVILDGLAGRILHKGDVLMGSGMVDHVRAVGGEDLVKTAAVTHGADEGDEVEGGVFITELKLDVVGVIFVNIEDDELLGIVRGNLTADLAADGATTTRDKDDLAPDEGIDLFHLDLDGLTAEEVFNSHILEGGDTDLIGDELIHAGELLDLAAGLGADIQNFTAGFHIGGGNGEKDFIYFIFLYR